MSFAAGSVVTLKSGGVPMTVVAASGDDIECIWIGEEGEFFRQTIPAVALEAAVEADEDDEDEDEEENEEEDEDEDDEEEEDTAKKRKRA